MYKRHTISKHAIFEWNQEKEKTLLKQRGVNFSMVTEAIFNENLLHEDNHPNSQKYPNQRIFIVAHIHRSLHQNS